MIITEEELKPYYNQEGILDIPGMHRFLQSKGVLTINEEGQISIYAIRLAGKIIDCPYYDCIKQIDAIFDKKFYKKAGMMGIDKNVIAKEVNKVDEKVMAELEKKTNEQIDEIRAEDIEL